LEQRVEHGVVHEIAVKAQNAFNQPIRDFLIRADSSDLKYKVILDDLHEYLVALADKSG